MTPPPKAHFKLIAIFWAYLTEDLHAPGLGCRLDNPTTFGYSCPREFARADERCHQPLFERAR
jgi:hypothetical protein